MTAWSEELSRARATLRLSQREVATRTGISEASYARYESGERTPKREALLRVCGVLNLGEATTNEALANAGYAPELTGPIKVLEKRTAGVPSTREALDSYPWVCELSNEFFEIRAWNVPALQVAEMDFAQFERPDQRHFLRLASLPHFRQRLTNWDSLIGNMIGFWKQSFDDGADAADRKSTRLNSSHG